MPFSSDTRVSRLAKNADLLSIVVDVLEPTPRCDYASAVTGDYSTLPMLQHHPAGRAAVANAVPFLPSITSSNSESLPSPSLVNRFEKWPA